MTERTINLDYLRAVRRIQKRRGDRIITGDTWLEKFSGVDRYENAFDRVLEKTNLRLREIASEHDPHTVAFDCMGNGTVLNPSELNVAHGLAVGLPQPCDEPCKLRPSYKNVDFIPGIIEYPVTWQAIDNWLQQLPVETERLFNLILCRPYGGMYMLPYHPIKFYQLAQNLWERLSSDNGVLLTEAPQFKILDNWISLLHQQDITVYYDRFNTIQTDEPRARLLFRKQTSSPKQLPTLAANLINDCTHYELSKD